MIFAHYLIQIIISLNEKNTVNLPPFETSSLLHNITYKKWFTQYLTLYFKNDYIFLCFLLFSQAVFFFWVGTASWKTLLLLNDCNFSVSDSCLECSVMISGLVMSVCRVSVRTASRAKLGMLNTVSKIRGQVKTTGYPQTEGLLGDCMLRYGREMGEESTFGNVCTYRQSSAHMHRHAPQATAAWRNASRSPELILYLFHHLYLIYNVLNSHSLYI